MVGSFSDLPRIGNDISTVLRIFSKKFGNGILGGRHNIWWCWMAGPVAPHNVNEVSYAMVTKIVSFSA